VDGDNRHAGLRGPQLEVAVEVAWVDRIAEPGREDEATVSPHLAGREPPPVFLHVGSWNGGLWRMQAPPRGRRSERSQIRGLASASHTSSSASFELPEMITSDLADTESRKPLRCTESELRNDG